MTWKANYPLARSKNLFSLKISSPTLDSFEVTSWNALEHHIHHTDTLVHAPFDRSFQAVHGTLQKPWNTTLQNTSRNKSNRWYQHTKQYSMMSQEVGYASFTIPTIKHRCFTSRAEDLNVRKIETILCQWSVRLCWSKVSLTKPWKF